MYKEGNFDRARCVVSASLLLMSYVNRSKIVVARELIMNDMIKLVKLYEDSFGVDSRNLIQKLWALLQLSPREVDSSFGDVNIRRRRLIAYLDENMSQLPMIKRALVLDKSSLDSRPYTSSNANERYASIASESLSDSTRMLSGSARFTAVSCHPKSSSIYFGKISCLILLND